MDFQQNYAAYAASLKVKVFNYDSAKALVQYIAAFPKTKCSMRTYTNENLQRYVGPE